jgi:predicted nucleotidyltransferase
MLPFIEAQRSAIAELGRRFHVRRLDVFGSAARGTDFDPSRSDVDLLVSYDPDASPPTLTAYFDLQEELTALLGYPVDLVMSSAVRNPYTRGYRTLAGTRLCAVMPVASYGMSVKPPTPFRCLSMATHR